MWSSLRANVVDTFKSACEAANNAAAATGAKARDFANEAKELAKKVASKADEIGEDITDRAKVAAATAKQIGDRAIEKGKHLVQTAEQKVVQTGRAVSAKAKEVAKLALEKGKEGVQAAKKVTKAVIECAKQKVRNAIQHVVNRTAVGLTDFVTSKPRLEVLLRESLASKEALPSDGKIFGQTECKICQSDRQGIVPCPGFRGTQTIHYSNGIFTEPEALCKSMLELSKKLCAEVVGVYNSTAGGGDLEECLSNIDNRILSPAARTEADLILDKLGKTPPEPVTLYVHSQGGLIAQQALRTAHADLHDKLLTDTLKTRGDIGVMEADKLARAETNRRMASVNVEAFGTATDGWPTGSKVHVTVNEYDPVPMLINKAQQNHSKAMEENAGATGGFTKPKVTTISVPPSRFMPSADTHSMDSTYIEHGIPKHKGACLGCEKV